MPYRSEDETMEGAMIGCMSMVLIGFLLVVFIISGIMIVKNDGNEKGSMYDKRIIGNACEK